MAKPKGGGGGDGKPNFNPVIRAATAAQKQSNNIKKNQLKWARTVYRKDRKVTNEVVGQLIDQMDAQQAQASEDRERYTEVYQPLEDDYIQQADVFREKAAEFGESVGDFRENIADYRDTIGEYQEAVGATQGRIAEYDAEAQRLKQEAIDYGSDANRALYVGRAQADVAQAFEAKRQSATSELESFGLNPSATRYAALDLGVRTAEAAAQAAAGSQASLAVEDRSRAMMQAALDRILQARGLDMEALKAMAVGGQLEGSALEADLAAYGLDKQALDFLMGANNMELAAINIGKGYPGQIAADYQGAAQAGIGGAGVRLSTTASGSNTAGDPTKWASIATDNLNSWNTALQNQSEQYQAEQEAEAAEMAGWGELIGMFGGMGTKMFMQEGGAVPAEVSNSGGANVDDVPAALSVGEFIIPKDAATWLGEKSLYALVDKSRKEKLERANIVQGALPV